MKFLYRLLVLVTCLTGTLSQSYMQYCPLGTNVCPDPRLGGRSITLSTTMTCKWSDELPLKDASGKPLIYAYTMSTPAQQVESVSGQPAPAAATCYVYITTNDIAQLKRFIGDFDQYSTIPQLLAARMKQAGGSNVGILPGESVQFRYMPAVLILEDFMTLLPGTVSNQNIDVETNQAIATKDVSIVQALNQIQAIEQKMNNQ
jgi:hypothetical protein